MYALNDRTKYVNSIYNNEVERTLLIYVDNTLINGSYIKSLSYNAEIFDNNKISLGSALVDEIKVSINKEGITDLNEINEFYFEEKITYGDGTEDTIPIGYFYSLPNNVDTSSKDFINFTLKSKMELLKEPFKVSELLNSNPNLTRKQLVEEICNKYDLYLASENFINNNVVVGNYDDNTYATSYLTMISERAGGFAYIGRTKANGKLPLYIKSLNETDKVIIPNQTLGEYETKDKVTISKVSYTNGVDLIEQGDDTGITIYLSNNSIFSCTKEEVLNIYNSLKGLSFQSLVVKIWGDSTIDKGDLITIDDLTTFAQMSWEYQRGFIGSYRTKLEESKSSMEISKISATEERRLIRTEINELDGSMKIISEKVEKNDKDIKEQKATLEIETEKIETAVSQIDSQNEKIAKVTQTVDELNSKISDVADVTISGEDNDGQVELDNINQSEPIRIVIRPIGESISYLYPSSGLYPSDTLYPKTRTLRFHNKTTGEDFDFVLPDDILYYDSENYDEFILDYDALTCVINKKVGWNADGTTYVLDNPTTLEIDEYPHLEITDGDYEITLLGYDHAYIFVRLMAQNIYTTQFTTKAEVNSQINQVANAINLEVSQKVNEKEIISSLNNAIVNGEGVIELKTGSFIVDASNLNISKDGTLKAKNGTFEGKVTASEGEIGGFDLGIDKFTSDIVPLKDYTTADATKVRNYLMGSTTLTSAEVKLYDLNEDGKVDVVDYVKIQNLIKANVSTTNPGSLEINSKSPTKTLLIKDKDGNEIINLSLLGLVINGTDIENNLFYKSGDQMDILDYVGFAGFLTSSGKSVHFTIPTEKSMANISSATLTSYNLDIRHAEGGYLGTGITSIDGTIKVTIVKNNLLDVYMNFNKAFSVTNNIPLSVAVNELTITFD